tara:strand:+ start:517 stop:1599 length:1083 start_codon:yes stop_codon:yes gene_type:complete
MDKLNKTFFMPGQGSVVGETDLFNRGHRLEITHLATDYSVAFSAFLDDFSDAYTSEWSEDESYGRMDPIGNFRMTRRNISVAWRIPATSFQQAKDNLDKMNKIVSFLYPLYGKSGRTQTRFIRMGPYLKIKFNNLICNPLDGGPLLGWINGITVDPIFEEGVFMLEGDTIPGESTFAQPRGGINPTSQGVNYFPKTYRLNFEMTVLHEHSVGWRKNSEGQYIFRGKMGRSTEGKSFPYKTDVLPLEYHIQHAGRGIGTALSTPRKSQDPIDETDLTVDQVLQSVNGNPGNDPNDPSKILFDANGERALWWEKKIVATITGPELQLRPVGPNVEFYEKENPVGLSQAIDIMNNAEDRRSHN